MEVWLSLKEGSEDLTKNVRRTRMRVWTRGRNPRAVWGKETGRTQRRGITISSGSER